MTAPFKTILVATDFNELATAALHAAGSLAKATRSELVVLYADRFEPPTEFTATQLPTLAADLEESRKRAVSALDEYVSAHVSSGIPTRRLVREDSPVSAIVATADDVNADLIVMGTHGRGGIARLVLGSVAEGVLYRTERPVLTLRSGATARVVRRILCPIDVASPAREAIRTADQLATTLKADLILLNVASDPASATNARASLGELLPAPRENAETTTASIVLEGDAATEVLEYARQSSIDLVVLGTRGKRTTFGSVTTRIIRNADCAVLVIRCDCA